jgi:competence protein ComEC
MLIALTFVFGAWCLQKMPELTSAFWAFLLFPTFFLALLFRHQSVFRVVYLVLFGVLAGYFWVLLLAQHRLADALPTAWETKAIQIGGVFASLPQQLEHGEHFEFDVEKVLSPQAAMQRVVPQHISITQYHNDAFGHNVANEVKVNHFHAGQRWRLTVKLKRSHGTAN